MNCEEESIQFFFFNLEEFFPQICFCGVTFCQCQNLSFPPKHVLDRQEQNQQDVHDNSQSLSVRTVNPSKERKKVWIFDKSLIFEFFGQLTL